MLTIGEQARSRLSDVNPFRFSEPLPPEELIDREEELDRLWRLATSGNHARLAAPRRFGKTSLLRRLTERARADGWAAVHVNFFGVLTLADVAQRVEQAYAAELQGGLRRWFDDVRRTLRPTFRAGGGPLPAGVDVALDPQAEAPLLERLALPVRIAARDGTRTLVVFDEFQDVLAARERADAVLRSEIERHGDAASYVFAGSHVGMMRELFVDRRRAFYAQAAPVDLPPLRLADLVAPVRDRFAATGRDVGAALDPILDVGAGHPQRTMLLAHAVWDRTPPGGRADESVWVAAYDAVMRDMRGELRALWSSLAAGQRRVLTAIGENTAPLYAAGRAHGGTRGGAVDKAVRVLIDRGDVVEDPRTSTGHRVVDPLLAAWLREGRPADRSLQPLLLGEAGQAFLLGVRAALPVLVLARAPQGVVHELRHLAVRHPQLPPEVEQVGALEVGVRAHPDLAQPGTRLGREVPELLDRRVGPRGRPTRRHPSSRTPRPAPDRGRRASRRGRP